MKIAVIGATGLIGSAIVAHLSINAAPATATTTTKVNT